MSLAVLFACCGFMAGLVARLPSHRLSLHSSTLGRAAVAEVHSLLRHLHAADFFQRYWRTLKLLLHWIGTRVVMMLLQAAVLVGCYLLMAGSVGAFNATSQWSFSLSAMVGTMAIAVGRGYHRGWARMAWN